MLVLLLLLLWLLLITKCSLEIAVKAGMLGCGMLAYRFVGLSSNANPAREFYWPAECTCAIIRFYWPVKR